MKPHLMLLLVIALVGSGPSSAWAQGLAQPGLDVGSKAPKFTLQDQEGKERSLDEFLHAKGKLAVVFYRSADWCPFCKQQLASLQGEMSAFEAAGVQVVGISYDAPKTLKTFSDRTKITFPLLSDPDSKTIDAYHIRNDAAQGKTEGIPHPGIFLVDSAGLIRSKLFLANYRERPTAAAIIKAAQSFE